MLIIAEKIEIVLAVLYFKDLQLRVQLNSYLRIAYWGEVGGNVVFSLGKVLATKPVDLSSFPRTHMVEVPTSCSLTYTVHHCICTHIHKK